MSADRDLVLQAEARRQIALVGVDISVLGALFAEDIIHIHSNGLVHGKAALLAHIAKNRAFIAIERGPIEVRMAEAVAVMTGPMTNHMRRADGVEFRLTGMVTQIMKRDCGQWRFWSFQFTLTGSIQG